MSRYTTSDVKSFSTFLLKRRGLLEANTWHTSSNIIWSRNDEETGRIGIRVSTVMDDPPHIQLSYKTRRHNSEWIPIDYKVPLERVGCHFGGYRWFFRCPLYNRGRYCGRRVAILYQIVDYFGCRHCADLTYESCNESKRYRTGIFKLVADSWKADEYFETLKRTHYRGKPTRKYKKFLRLVGYERDVSNALDDLNSHLKGR